MSEAIYAPIAIFAYKRPKHLAQLMSSLEACAEFHKSPLYFFVDGAKTSADAALVEQSKMFCSAYSHEQKTVIAQSDNRGLANSIISGTNKLCEEFGRVIVLEDDLEVSPLFLNYMNAALERYANEEKVFHISGYQYPLKNGPENPFFFRNESCWGWATWQRAWKYFSGDAPDLKRKIDALSYRQGQAAFDVEGVASFYKMLQNQIDNKIDSWSICWDASIFLRRGLCLMPGGTQTYVRNAGFDGSGSHCGDRRYNELPLVKKRTFIFPSVIKEDLCGLRSFKNFYRQITFNKLGMLKKRLIYFARCLLG